jgi:ubiquinone/menaquinone biosynthesis C-methylase UbiE
MDALLMRSGGTAQHVRRRVPQSPTQRHTPQADYGYDAPYALLAFAGIGTLISVGAIAASVSRRAAIALALAPYGAFFLANAISFFYTTRRGKFHVWQWVLDGLNLRGDEEVLDLGCGRGAVLVAVGRRLTTGRVTGIDIWSRRDQSGNAREVTLRNAAIEGVQDRVDVRTADMRALPFGDGVFDVVVSSLAIHNVRSHAGRAKAVSEAWRVLKPGGRLAIADIHATRLYAKTLRALGADTVIRHRLGWRFWWGNPAASTTLLTASKPQAPRQ